VLFTEDVSSVPCTIFLSELDVHIPYHEVERYLRSKGAIFKDATDVGSAVFELIN
jgi:hypothetical protein